MAPKARSCPTKRLVADCSTARFGAAGIQEAGQVQRSSLDGTRRAVRRAEGEVGLDLAIVKMRLLDGREHLTQTRQHFGVVLKFCFHDGGL